MANLTWWAGVLPRPEVRKGEGTEEIETFFLKRKFDKLKIFNSSLWRENWDLNYLLYFKFTDRSSLETSGSFWK